MAVVNTVASVSSPVVNEVLCYVSSWTGVDSFDAIVKACTDFYKVEEIAEAKLILYSITNGLTGRYKGRRDGVRPKPVLDMEDLLREYLAADSADTEMPVFCAANARNLPPRSTLPGNSSVLLSELRRVTKSVDELANIVKANTPQGVLFPRVICGSQLGGSTERVGSSEPSLVACPGEAQESRSWSEVVASSSSASMSNNHDCTTSVKTVTPVAARSSCIERDGPTLPRVTQEESDGYQLMIGKKRRRADFNQRRQPVKTGTRNDETQVRGVPKKTRYVHVFVGRCAPDTSVATMEAFLHKEGLREHKVTQLQTRHPSYASFLVRVPKDDRSVIMDTRLWCTNIIIRRWRGSLPSEQLDTVQSQNMGEASTMGALNSVETAISLSSSDAGFQPIDKTQ